MDTSTTLITALYDIGRENLTGKNAYRPFSKYLNWFKYVLQMNVSMVIFIPFELQSYVLEHRPSQYKTKIILRKFEDLTAYKYYDRIQSTINTMIKEPNSDGKIPKYFSDCPEFITSKYEIVTYSKFDFLAEVANENPYKSKYFIWLNAGTFYQEPGFDCTRDWPDPYKIQLLEDKFLIPGQNFNVNDKTPLKDKRSYLRTSQNFISTYILGGTKLAIDRVKLQFWHEVENALRLGVINNEKHILQMMVLEQPTYYYLWYHTKYQYPKFPIYLRDRMIPYELTLGTFIGEHYATNPNIKLLTVATNKISSSSYQRWEKTAIHYGYNYEILGRQTAWKGFNTKIKSYYEKLKMITEPYAALTDSVDLFFCGSSTELYDKFIKMKSDLIIGGELEVYYPGGKHDLKLIKPFFESIKKSSQAFPNSGFIMGKTASLIKLMECHIDYTDDQVACFDTIFENKLPLTIDYDTILIGNIPNYKRDYDNQFIFDPIRGRYMNIINKEIPVVLHFPGKNYHQMNNFYVISQPDIATQQSTNPTPVTGWIFVWLIIVIILLFIFAFIFKR